MNELWCANAKLLSKEHRILLSELSVVEVLGKKLPSRRCYVRHGGGRFHV